MSIFRLENNLSLNIEYDKWIHILFLASKLVNQYWSLIYEMLDKIIWPWQIIIVASDETETYLGVPN